jgi:hypothetical protein
MFQGLESLGYLPTVNIYCKRPSKFLRKFKVDTSTDIHGVSLVTSEFVHGIPLVPTSRCLPIYYVTLTIVDTVHTGI